MQIATYNEEQYYQSLMVVKLDSQHPTISPYPRLTWDHMALTLNLSKAAPDQNISHLGKIFHRSLEKIDIFMST